jgi:copper resistance protein B
VALALALAGALPPFAIAQTTGNAQSTPPTSHDMTGMDHASMPGMAMSDTPPDASKAAKKKKPPPRKSGATAPSSASSPAGTPAMDHGAMPGMNHGAMPGMDHGAMHGTSENASVQSDAAKKMDHASMPGMDHGQMKSMDHAAMSRMTMGPMQGGRALTNARSPDYSDGVRMGPMTSMDMADNASLGMLLVDQLEAFHGSNANGQVWEAEGWYGNDRDKIWLRTEGERSRGKIEDADLELFWNRNVATFWSTQIGLRQDAGEGPSRTWAAVGVQGLAPYWFELEATAYVGEGGRTAARLRAEYELLFTQRLILQPELEVNLYGRDEPARRVGSGLSDAQFLLRLRYEFSRQFAPYVGIGWTRSFGTTADYVRQAHQSLLDRRIVAGVRFWF